MPDNLEHNIARWLDVALTRLDASCQRLRDAGLGEAADLYSQGIPPDLAQIIGGLETPQGKERPMPGNLEHNPVMREQTTRSRMEECSGWTVRRCVRCSRDRPFPLVSSHMRCAECRAEDEVARLRQRVAELEAALRPFARADMPEDADDDSTCVNHLTADSEPMVGDFRRARAALEGQ